VFFPFYLSYTERERVLYYSIAWWVFIERYYNYRRAGRPALSLSRFPSIWVPWLLSAQPIPTEKEKSHRDRQLSETAVIGGERVFNVFP
jgi:hypothetical protein